MVLGRNPDTVITDEVSMSAFNKQEGGSHYTKCKIQPFQYSMANGLDPMQHTVVKYVTRFRDKGGVADLKKAIHTLELLIEHEELPEAELAKAKPTAQPKPMTLMGLPLPLGTDPTVVYDLQVILDHEARGRNLPQARYDAAQELFRKHIKLAWELQKGDTTAYIVATSYWHAEGLARRMGWMKWTYCCPQSYNFKGVSGRVYVVSGVRLTDTAKADLFPRNIVIQLD